MRTARGRGRGGSRGAARGRGGARGGATKRPMNKRGGPARKQQREDGSTSHDANFESTMPETLNFSQDLRPYFLQPTPFIAHQKAQEEDRLRYVAGLQCLSERSVEVLQSNKVRGLIAAWVRGDNILANYFMKQADLLDVGEILKALQLMDAGRKSEAEKKRAERLAKLMEKVTTNKGRSSLGRKIAVCRQAAHAAEKQRLPSGSVSGSMARKIKRWTRSLTKDQLEYFALHMSKTTWQQIADLCHLHPERDFPNCPWFLRYCYDETAAPGDSLVGRCSGLCEENVNEYVMNVDIPYAHIKQFAKQLKVPAKKRIAEYTKDLDTILWHYEDLSCAGVDDMISKRLSDGEKITLTYGKLMERLLMLRQMRENEGRRNNGAGKVTVAKFYAQLMPFAEAMLKDITLELESPVVVIGDASASMEVAINTSTIIGSLLRALTDADLVFFSNDVMEPKFIPKTVQEVIELAMVTKTVASTCHASALWPYYKQKKVVKTFVVTTDEEENTQYRPDKGKTGYMFIDLFKKYHAEVYPARLVFVSFLHRQHSKGQMVEPLKAAGYDVMQFKLDGNRPDLSKLNNMVGQMSLQANFEQSVAAKKTELETSGKLESTATKVEALAQAMEKSTMDWEVVEKE